MKLCHVLKFYVYNDFLLQFKRQLNKELDDEEGIPSIVPFDVTKGGSLNRRLVLPQSPSPQIGNKIGLKFGKNKRKCKFIFQNIWIVLFLHPFERKHRYTMWLGRSDMTRYSYNISISVSYFKNIKGSL